MIANISALKVNQLRWFENLQRTDQWINKIQRFKITGNAGIGRPPKSWKNAITDDLESWKLPDNLRQDHDG